MKVSSAILMPFLVSLATANFATEYSNYPDAYAVIQNPCNDTRNGQFICKDCATLAICIQENGNWNSMDISTCDTNRGFYCDENVRGCVYKKECISRGPKFECQNSGIFPDPYDCKQYHVCNLAKEDDRFMCPQGTAYSPATKSCTLSQYDDICYKAQYTCDNPLDMAAWPTDANIYYICWYTIIDGEIVRYPLLYRCPDGYEFKANNCVPVWPAPTDSLISPTTPSTTASSTLITTATPSTTESASCTTGSGIRVNPNDCYSYYMCKNGQLESTRCPSDTYFNPITLSCVFGNC